MDPQQPYSPEPAPWHNDRDEPPRPPGQRDPRYGERYPEDASRGDDPRYADDPRYGDEDRYPDGSPYGDDQRYRDAYIGGYPGNDDPRSDSGEHPLDVGDQRYDASEPGRADVDRSRTRGQRSGLELPGDESDQTREELSPRYRTEMLDRGALRRPPGDPATLGAPGAGIPSSPSGAPIPLVPQGGAPGSSMPSPAAPGSPAAAGPVPLPPSSTVYQAGATPTQAIPSATSPKEAYRARRSGIAWLLGTVAIVVELLVLIKVLAESIYAHPTHTGGVLAGVFAICGVPMIAIGLYGLATGAPTAAGPNVGRAWLRTPLAYLPVGLIMIIAAGLAG